jgi:DNA-binding protein HU-beta
MNKSELINEISQETTLNKKDVVAVLDSAFRIIMRTLKKGLKVSITGFGSFQLSYRPKRKGINPATRQSIDLPAITVPRFKAGKQFKEIVRPVAAAAARQADRQAHR